MEPVIIAVIRPADRRHPSSSRPVPWVEGEAPPRSSALVMDVANGDPPETGGWIISSASMTQSPINHRRVKGSSAICRSCSFCSCHRCDSNRCQVLRPSLRSVGISGNHRESSSILGSYSSHIQTADAQHSSENLWRMSISNEKQSQTVFLPLSFFFFYYADLCIHVASWSISIDETTASVLNNEIVCDGCSFGPCFRVRYNQLRFNLVMNIVTVSHFLDWRGR